MSNIDPLQLRPTAYNHAGQTTIVLIHTTLVSGLYWDLIIPTSPFLTISEYQISPAMEIPSTVLDGSLSPPHRRQNSHAINGSAHIIGRSLGAHVAIRPTSNDPDVVGPVFISGFEIFPQTLRRIY
jgi:pimeloyl-ACP methyl ester carboxylesterase